MEGSPQPTDYAAILADMEAKYAALGNAITSLRAVLATGALGIAVGDALALKDSVSVSLSPTPSQGPISLPRGAFLGKKAPEAIKLYLSAARKKQSNKEIAQALRDGGLESTGNFDAYVTSSLFRLKQDGVVLRFDDGWGLAEWYPESFRTRVGEKAGNNGKKKTKKKAASKVKKPAEPKVAAKAQQAPTEGLEMRIVGILRSEQNRIFTSQEIAQALSVNPGAVSLALGRMAGKGKAEKAEGGYRTLRNVQEMSAKAS